MLIFVELAVQGQAREEITVEPDATIEDLLTIYSV